MKLAFALPLLALLFAIPAHANGLDVYVTAWQVSGTDTSGVIESQTFWTFGAGLKGPAPVDPNAQDLAYYGFAQPFVIEDYAVGNTNTYFATYGTYGYGATKPNTFSGTVNLTDKNGFVSGLPFECTANCNNVIYSPDNGLAEFSWLNSSLPASTGGEPGHPGRGKGHGRGVSGTGDPLTGSATLTVGDPITGSASLTVNPTPTPEPSSLVLLGLGIVAAIALYRASAKTQSQNPRLVE